MNMPPVVHVDVSMPQLRLQLQQLVRDDQGTLQTLVTTTVAKMQENGELSRIVESEAAKALEQVLKTEVQDYFRFGSGRKQVHEAVIAQLNEWFSDVEGNKNGTAT